MANVTTAGTYTSKFMPIIGVQSESDHLSTPQKDPEFDGDTRAHFRNSALERLREEDQKYQSSLDYIRSPKPNKIKTHNP